jgi:hypothetical protein
MTTNKIVLKTADEFMAGFQPVYTPIYPILLAGKSVKYVEEVGTATMRTVNTVGDIRAKRVTPKDTELRQIAVNEGSKSFKKYFLMNQYIQSQLQSSEGINDVVAQVLDEHNLQADEMLLTAEGTTNETAVNNGLYFSQDPNYVVKDSVAIASGSTRLYDFHTKVVASYDEANQVAGRKLIIFYGSNILPLYNSLYDTAAKAWKQSLKDVLGENASIMQLPVRATPSGANGWLVINIDQVKIHYTMIPQLLKQGLNDEKGYVWSNFGMGSMMVEVLAYGGIIRQAATLA